MYAIVSNSYEDSVQPRADSHLRNTFQANMAYDIELPILEAYDVSPRTGFLPEIVSDETNLPPIYLPWIHVTQHLQNLIMQDQIRSVVDGLPVLSCQHLETISQRRKAYSMLGFICHAYIWGGEEPAEV